MAEHTEDLVLQVDTSQLDRARGAIDLVSDEFYELAEVAPRVTAATQTIQREFIELAGDTYAVRDAFEDMVTEIIQSSQSAASGVQRMTAATGAAMGGIKALGAAKNDAAAASSRWGLAVNAAAQGVEDFQYSVGGAMNNFSQMAMILGASGGIVAGLTLAGVAANQLYLHWNDIQALFGNGKTEAEAAAMKKLADETERTGKAFSGFVGGLSAGDTARGGAFAKSVDATLKPGETREQLINDLITLVQARNGPQGDKEATAAAVRDRFGKALQGDKDSIDFLKAYAGDARPDSLGKRFAEQLAQEEKIAAIRQRMADAQNDRDMRHAVAKGQMEERMAEEKARKEAVEAERAMRHATGKGAAAELAEAERKQAEMLTSEGLANEPDARGMREARRLAALSDVRRAGRNLQRAQANAAFGGGRMGIMQRQLFNRMRGFGAGGRMGIMQRQFAAKFGGGQRGMKAQEDLRTASEKFADAVEKLASEGVKVTI